MRAKLLKIAALSRRRSHVGALFRHRVAAAIEHRDAIAFCRARSLIDVGANKGQFSLAFLGQVPNGTVHAFEPLSDAANRYEAVLGNNPNVRLHRCAIGSKAGKAKFYVTDRQDSSSLFEPGEKQKEAFDVALSEQIEVPVERLETRVDLQSLPAPVMMKIDVQGGELAVLKGVKALDAIDCIYVELSFVELYLRQPLFEEVRGYLAKRGFTLRGVYNQASTASFGPTQADCLFVRAA